MNLSISPRVRHKLEQRHKVSEDEIRQCFENGDGEFLRDSREQHHSDLITWWFIAETNRGRKLKVCFVVKRVETPEAQKTVFEIKTAYPPNDREIALYDRCGKC